MIKRKGGGKIHIYIYHSGQRGKTLLLLAMIRDCQDNTLNCDKLIQIQYI